MGSAGFTVGDFDPAFPLDDRFLALRALLGDATRYYAATGLWWHIVAACWRDAGRKSAERTVPDGDPDLLAALVRVGLLGEDMKVTTRTYGRWIGKAVARRRESSEYKRRYRAQKSGSSPVGVRPDSHGLSQSGQSVSNGGVRGGSRLVPDTTPYTEDAVAKAIQARLKP